MLPKNANLQKIRDNKRTYGITPHLPGGFIKPELMRRFAEVAEKYGAVLKVTSAQRILITNLQAEDVEKAWQDLGMQPAMGAANCVRSIKVCPGTAFCKRAKQDSVKLGLELDRLYHKQEMPSRMKMGVAGCPNSCSEIYIKDIGILGTDKGWTLYAGGTAGAHPRLANEIAADLNYEQVLRLVAVIVDYYRQHAEIERLGQLIDRIGIEKFRTDILKEFHNDHETMPQIDHQEFVQKQEPAIMGSGTKQMAAGDPITANSIIGEIIQVYPQTIPVLRSFGMGCLGCPSATGEEIEKAAGIHGLNLADLLPALNKVI
ncbi:MAG: redox-disulfide-like protein [Firmicutes bacterium]|nr:redox-disulfide-like protein [Bacillota bacterium]